MRPALPLERQDYVFLWLHVCVYMHYALAIYSVCVVLCFPAQLTELSKLNVVMMFLQEKAVWMEMLLMVKMMMTMITGKVMAVNID